MLSTCGKFLFLISLLAPIILSQTLQCIDPNCISCVNPLNCTQCPPSYTINLINNNGVCGQDFSCNVTSCITCLNDNYCSSCQSYYTIINGTCVCESPFEQFNNTCICPSGNETQCFQCNIDNCLYCISDQICAQCIQGYTLYDPQFCMLCNISDCIYCSDENYCQECNNGTVPNYDSDECVVCLIDQCLYCGNSTTCEICQDGFQVSLDSTLCVECNVEGCIGCINNNVCGSCGDGYQLNNVTGECFICLYPCSICDQDGNCVQCQQPYSISAFEGQCYFCQVDNCVSCDYNNTSSCLTCQQGYILNSDGGCVQGCDVDFCSQCTNNGQCASCQYFFILQEDGSCAQCDQAPACLNCTANNLGFCTLCNSGYYLSQGNCLPCQSYCLKCTSGTVCQTLKNPNGYTLVNAGTQVAQCNSGCITCSLANPNLCITCSPGFSLIDGACVPCIYPCKTCSSSNLTSCLSCYPGVFLVSNACVECNPSCLTCASSNLNLCTTCPTGQALINGTCDTSCPINCNTCTNGTYCTVCTAGYVANSSGLCQPCLSNCKQCASTMITVCLQCGTGFYLQNGSCNLCPNMCSSCISSKTQVSCQSCYPGFNLTANFECAAICISPCATCSPSNPFTCFSCIAGYTFNNYSFVCTPITTCANSKCSFCPFQYILNNQACVPCSSNCARCQSISARSVCTACSSGYYLFNNTCLACKASCLACNSLEVCTFCANGYTFEIQPSSSILECVGCQSPCSSCSRQPTQCTSCVSGYKLVGWKCVTTFNLQFSFTLNINFNTFFTSGNYFAILVFLRNAALVSNTSDITMNIIYSGSASIAGTVTLTASPNSIQSSNSLSNLNRALKSGGSANGIPILSSVVSVNGGIIPTSNDPTNTNNLPIILGITIPMGILFVAGIALYIYCKYKLSSRHINKKIHEQELTVRTQFEAYVDETDRP